MYAAIIILLHVVASLFSIITAPYLFKFQLYAQMQPGIQMFSHLLPVILIGIVFAIVFIFALLQLVIGLARMTYNVYTHKTFRMFDLIQSYTKGSYLKSVRIGLCTMLIFSIAAIISTILNVIVTLGFGTLFSFVEEAVTNAEHSLGIAITIITIAQIITSAVAIIPIIFGVVWMISMITSHVQNPDQTIARHFKTGLRIFRNGHNTFAKWFIGLFLMYFLYVLLSTVTLELVPILLGNMSQSVAEIIAIALNVLMIVILAIVNILIVSSIIVYFINNRKSETVKYSGDDLDDSLVKENETQN